MRSRAPDDVALNYPSVDSPQEAEEKLAQDVAFRREVMAELGVTE